MAKRRPKMQPEARRPKNLADGQRTYSAQGKRILTHSVGALPILNRLLERMRLHELLTRHLAAKDKRSKVDAPRVALLILRNLLVSREPMYGVVEWARNFGPELFDLWPEELDHLNDDRVGRVLEQVFMALETNLIMDVATHVVQEFDVRLDELHNDSTTVTSFGDYPEAQQEERILGRTVPAITWRHNKDHRPDLKQLLYLPTVSDDGGVPVYFQSQSGNVTTQGTRSEIFISLLTRSVRAFWATLRPRSCCPRDCIAPGRCLAREIRMGWLTIPAGIQSNWKTIRSRPVNFLQQRIGGDVDDALGYRPAIASGLPPE